VKSFHDEEARVWAHEASKAHPDGCGALSLETPDGRRFSCGSGLTEKDRCKPPAVSVGSLYLCYSFSQFVRRLLKTTTHFYTFSLPCVL